MSILDTEDKGSKRPKGALYGASPGAALRRAEIAATAVRRRPWTALLIVLLALVGGYWAKSQVKPQYRVEALIEIDPIVPHVAFTGEEWRAESFVHFYKSYASTLVKRMKSRPLMLRAVDRLAEEGVEWIDPDTSRDMAATILPLIIEVELVRDANLLTISATSSDPDWLKPVVAGVVDVFFADMALVASEELQWKIEALETERSSMTSRVAAVHQRLEELAKPLGSATLDDREDIFFERVNALEVGRTDVRVERALADGRVLAATTRASQLLAEDVQGEVDLELAEDAGLAKARQDLEVVEREVEVETRGMNERHPQYGFAMKRVESAKSTLARLTSAAEARIRERLQRKRQAEARHLLEQARRQAEAAKLSESRIDDMVTDARSELQSYGRAIREATMLRSQVTQILGGLRRVDDEIDRVRVEARAPGRTRLMSPPVEPLLPYRDRSRLAGLIAAVVLLALGGAVLYAWQLLDERVTVASAGRVAKYWTVTADDVPEVVAQLACREDAADALFAGVDLDLQQAGLGEALRERFSLAVPAVSPEALSRWAEESDGGGLLWGAPPEAWGLCRVRGKISLVVLLTVEGVTRTSRLRPVLKACQHESVPAVVVIVPRRALQVS